MLIKGRVERFSRRTISGWLSVAADPEKKPLLELVLDGRTLKVAAANQYRADLQEAGWGGGHCYFEFNLDPPLSEAEAERVKLRIGGSDLCLELPRKLPADRRSNDQGPVTAGLKVFIVGSPRSGTSVLLRAIQQEFGLPARGESHVIPAIARLAHELRRYHERFRDNQEDLLIHQLPVADFEEALFHQVRAFYGAVFGDRGWVDKTPSDEAVYGAGLIPHIFPDAKIIVTKRNGVEVVDSHRRKFSTSVEKAARSWTSVMHGIDGLMASHRPRVLVVDQFDFTNNAMAVSRKVAGYLGRPEQAGPLAEYLQGDRLDSLSSHDWSQQATLSDVDWSAAEKTLFVDLCGEQMVRHGYAMWPSEPERAPHRLAAGGRRK
jgi:hypothetical protein